MTPIEKASKLTSYYLPFCNNNITDAKYCALIALDEILNLSKIASLRRDEVYMELEYWLEVKQEIENL